MCITTLEDTNMALVRGMNDEPNALAHPVYVRLAKGLPVPSLNAEPNGTVKAYINHSRWVIDCPYCSNARIASKVDPRFWCENCGMEKNGGAPLAVIFPRQASEIERVLCLRPEPKTRNWYTDETIETLRAENAEHGIEE